MKIVEGDTGFQMTVGSQRICPEPAIFSPSYGLMDELTNSIQNEVKRSMLCGDEIVLMDEISERA